MKKLVLSDNIIGKKTKIILLFAISLLWQSILQAQKQPNIKTDTTWISKVNHIFEGIDKSKVPHGILLDYAMEFTDLTAYNGTLNDSIIVDANVFSSIYKTLLMGMVQADTTHLPLFNTVAYQWAHNRAKYNQAEKGTVVLAGLYYKYARFAQNALSQNKITVNNNQFFDKYINDVWQNPYETLQTIAYTPPINKMDKLSFGVVLPTANMLSNSINEIQNISVDFGDSNGYHDITNGEKVHADYSQNGIYTWTFKTTLHNGTILYSRTNFLINAPSTTSTTTSGGDGTNIFIPGPMHFINGIPMGGAILRIDYAPGHNNKIIKPFIVAEGFDPGSVTNPEIEGGSMTLKDFMKKIKNEYRAGNLHNLLYKDSPTQEYDVIYVDWVNGTADIRENAQTLENVLHWVNQRKHANGSSEQNVLMGQSMGGLVARYTLATLEHRNEEQHEVRLFIAHDSPMQGANIPIGLQAASKHLQHIYVSSPILWAMGEIVVPLVSLNGLLFDYSSPNHSFYVTESPAYKQMSYQYLHLLPYGYLIPDTQLHNNWQQEFESVGYPTQCRNIAISNGNECAVDHGFNPHAKLFNFHATTHNGISITSGNSTTSFDDFFTGLIFSDPRLILAGVVPGSSTYKFDFIIRANPSRNEHHNREVYSGRIRFNKEYFWGLFSVTFNLAEGSFDAPDTDKYLPFSTYTGGYQKLIMEDVYIGNTNVADAITQDHYGFIPTVSSLDVKRNNHEVDKEDYKKSYAGGEMPEPALSTPFDNFIVDYNQGTPVNNAHISFQARNGNWLAAEISATNNNYPVYDCSSMCGFDNEIVGDDIICDANEHTYSLTNYYGNIDWDINPSYTIVNESINTNQELVLTRMHPNGAGGLVLISAHIGNQECGSKTFYKEIWVGKPQFDTTLHSGPHISFVSLNFTPNMQTQGITNIEWVQTGGNGSIMGLDGDLMCDASGPGDDWWVRGTVTVTNACGSTTKNFIISPRFSNPENCEDNNIENDLYILNVAYKEYKVVNQCSGEFSDITNSKLFDQYGEIIREIQPDSDEKIVIPGEESGRIIILVIITEDGVKSKTLIVE